MEGSEMEMGRVKLSGATSGSGSVPLGAAFDLGADRGLARPTPLPPRMLLPLPPRIIFAADGKQYAVVNLTGNFKA
jgi:hypothetical protein